MMKGKILVLMLLLLISGKGFGQVKEHWEKKLRFDHLTPAIQDSLQSKKVNCFLRDRNGNSWFGTKQGLVYFNGHDIISVQDTTNTGIPIHEIEIQDLVETSQGDIWMGTKNFGVLRYQAHEKIYQQYSLASPKNSDREISSVLSLCEGDKNDMWAGTFGGGVYHLDSLQNTFSVFQDQTDSSKTLATAVVMDLHKDKHGIVWVATLGMGLARIDPHYQSMKLYKSSPEIGSLSIDDLFSLEEDEEGTLWIGTYGKGLLQYDRRTETFGTPFPELNNDYIQDLLYDRGYLWIATQQNGLYCLSPQRRLLENFSQQSSNPYSISNNSVNQVGVDDYGILWVVSDNAVDVAHVENIVFSYLGNHNSSPLNQPITALATDKGGNIWIGTSDASLFQWQVEDESLIEYSIDFSGDSYISFNTNIISTIAQDDTDGIWVGTSDGTIARWDLLKKQWKQYQLPLLSSTSEPIESIYLDMEGRLWIGVLEQGLYYWNKEDDSIRSASALIPSLNASFTPKVFAEDEQYLWIGTLSQGIIGWNKSTNQLINHIKNAENQNGLTSNQITGLATDAREILYIGTFDQGICRLNTVSGKFNQFTEQDGLLSNRVTSVSKGKGNKIWIGSVEGITSIDPKTNKIINYSNQEFLNGKELVHYSESTNNEQLLFGTLSGVVQVKSENKNKLYKNPLLLITKFDSKQHHLGFEPYKEEQRQIDLSYDDNAVEIAYSLQHFMFSENHHYEYRLDGFEQSWKPVGHRTLASYTNLAPGTYRFYVRGRTAQDLWVDQVNPLLIVVHPAWYQTLLFKIISCLLLLLVTGGAYYYRIISVQKRNRILESLVLERTLELTTKNRFIEEQHHDIQRKNQKLEEAKSTIQQKNSDLQNLNEALEERVNQRTQELASTNEALVKTNTELDLFVYRAYHDIIGPIARIEGLGQVAAMELGENQAVTQYLDRLQENCLKARTTLQKVLQIHHVRNHVINNERINLSALIHQLCEEASLISANRPLIPKLDIQCDTTLTVLTDRNLISLILNSFILNAFQYSRLTEDSFIRIIVDITALEELRLIVIDNGEGIPEKVREKVFSMFFRGHETKSGTGLGLYIAHLAAEKLGGGVLYKETDEYTKFSVELDYKTTESVTDEELDKFKESVL